MGIFIDKEILDLQKKMGDFILPFFPGKIGNPSFGLSSCGYDITLGHEFAYFSPPDEKGFEAIDLSDFDPDRLPMDKYKSNLYEIPPGDFVLGYSAETLKIPNDVVGFVFDKSSLARLGLSLFNTVLEPGWCGQITLELANTNKAVPLIVRAGMGIAQVIFFRLEEPCAKAYGKGKYQNQKGVVLAK